MKMKADVAEALNQQINAELQASHAYLAMAAYFESIDLPGFAGWFRAQSQEENEHGLRIYDYLAKRGARVELGGLDKPTATFESPADVVRTALEMEQVVTAQIHNLFDLAQSAKDYSTQAMLQWFIDEQIEEEDLFGQVLNKVEAAADNRWNLLVLDEELKGRGGAEPDAAEGA